MIFHKYILKYDATTEEFVSTVLIQSLSKLTDKELEQFYLLSDSVRDHQKSTKNTFAYAKQTPTQKVNLVKPSTNSPLETIFQKLFSRNRTRNMSTSQSQAIANRQIQTAATAMKCEKPKCDNKQQETNRTDTNVRRKTNYGIMKTNSFTIEITVSKVVISPAQKRKIIKVNENRLALFPNISRLNHSCQPNCNHYWCGQAGKFMIRAIR